MRGILGKYLKSRGQRGAREFLGEIIPTSANRLGTQAQIAWAGHGFTISGPSRSRCMHPLRNQYTTALSDRRILSRFSTHCDDGSREWMRRKGEMGQIVRQTKGRAKTELVDKGTEV